MPTPIFLPDETEYWIWPDGDYLLWGDELMTFALADITYRVARELGIVTEGVATSGTTSTIVDSDARDEDDDYWNKGTAWILRDAAGASAAPEKEYSVIQDFTATNDTIVLQDSLTVAVGEGDRYAVAEKYVPLQIIIQKINQALNDLGRIPYVDTTSLTISDNKTEYTLPIASKLDFRLVSIQTNKVASNNYWNVISNAEVEQADPGAAPTLILPEQYSSGYKLKLEYMANHPNMYQPTDPLSETVPVERVVIPAVLECLRYRRQKMNTDDFDADIKDYTDRKANLAVNYPIRLPPRPSRVGIVHNVEAHYDDLPGKVYL